MNDFLGVESYIVEAVLNHISGPAKRASQGLITKLCISLNGAKR